MTWRNGSAGWPARSRRSSSSRCTTPTSRCGSRTSTRPRSCSVGGRMSISTTASGARSRGTASGSPSRAWPRRREVPRPGRGAGRRGRAGGSGPDRLAAGVARLRAGRDQPERERRSRHADPARSGERPGRPARVRLGRPAARLARGANRRQRHGHAQMEPVRAGRRKLRGHGLLQGSRQAARARHPAGRAAARPGRGHRLAAAVALLRLSRGAEGRPRRAAGRLCRFDAQLRAGLAPPAARLGRRRPGDRRSRWRISGPPRPRPRPPAGVCLGPLPLRRRRSSGRRVSRPRRASQRGLPRRSPASAHGADRLAVPDLARLQLVRRRPERDPGQLVPLLAEPPRLAPRGDRPRRPGGRLQGRASVLAVALRAPPTRPERHRRRARAPAAVRAAALPGDRLSRPHRVLRAAHLEAAARLPRPGRSPRLPAGESVLPPGEARQGPKRDGHDRLRCARPRVLRLRARRSRVRRLLLPQVARGTLRRGNRRGLRERPLALSRDRDRARPGIRLRGLRERPDRPRALAARSRRRGRGGHPRQLRRRERGAGLVAGGARRGVRDRQLQLPENAEGSHVDAARQRLAQAGLVAVLLLAGCGSSAPPHRAALRLALPVLPRTLDPAKAGDMPSLNVTHELYAGLTRFSGRGVVPDLAESWDVQRGGVVWVFHLRKNLRWSDDRRLTAQDVRRSWLRALAPATEAPLAGPDLGIIRGARAYHASGRASVGIEAPDDRTLRVTLQHPIPWLDQLVAHPIAAAWRPNAYSGPFRLAGRSALERNFNYWNARAIRPSRVVLTTQTKGADAILPRGLAPPGLPWVQTAKPPSGAGWTKLKTLSVQLLWAPHESVASPSDALVPDAMPGYHEVVPRSDVAIGIVPTRSLTLAYTTQDALAREAIRRVRRIIRTPIVPRPYSTVAEVVRGKADLVLLGWSSKIFDAYNIFDLFPCASAFNVAHWCDHDYDALMRRAVRTLDDQARW